MSKEEALGLAAQAWCKKGTSHIPMIPALAEAFADILLSALAERDAEVQRLQKAMMNIRNNAIMVMATCDLWANNEARIGIILKESEVKG